MASQKHLVSAFILFFLLKYSCVKQCIAAVIPVGVVLDLNSTVGELAESCIFMAVTNFYEVNAHYRTRLALFSGIPGAILLVLHAQVTIIFSHAHTRPGNLCCHCRNYILS